MRAIKEILAEAAPKFNRFQVLVKNNEGKKKTVGMAYLKEGISMYTIRLWTFLKDKYFLK